MCNKSKSHVNLNDYISGTKACSVLRASIISTFSNGVTDANKRALENLYKRAANKMRNSVRVVSCNTGKAKRYLYHEADLNNFIEYMEMKRYNF